MCIVMILSQQAEMGKDFDDRVFAVAFTDSVHSFAYNEPSIETSNFFEKVEFSFYLYVSFTSVDNFFRSQPISVASRDLNCAWHTD